MIDEDRTMQLFGYYSTDLKPKSNKKIVCVCDDCGKYRNIQKSAYRNLCQMCSNSLRKGVKIWDIKKHPQLGKHHSDETKKKIKNAQIGEKSYNYGKHHSDETKKKIGLGNQGKIVSNETKIKMSISKQNMSEETKIRLSCAKQGITREDWDGFLTNQKYCTKFNEQLRKQIRSKYNNCDYISGLHKDICEPNRNLSVHHINYDKNCGCNGVKCKLIPLSNSNHIKTNANRWFWHRLFIYSLEFDETYYKDNKINIMEMI